MRYTNDRTILNKKPFVLYQQLMTKKILLMNFVNSIAFSKNA